MAASDDRAEPWRENPDPAEPAPHPAGGRIGAGTLAAADQVNRYHAQRLAEHRQATWRVRDEAATHEDDEPA
jgi:hypothetical protein